MSDDGQRDEERYIIREKIGAGGMGTVFSAYHVGPAGFKKTVALKVMNPGFEAFAYLFAEEARIMTMLDHPNIVQVHSLFEQQRRLNMVMEFVDGPSVSELIRRANGSMIASDH